MKVQFGRYNSTVQANAEMINRRPVPTNSPCRENIIQGE